MNLKKLYLGLALYFFAVGVFGWLRTGSLVPLIITGSAGLITASLGWWTKKSAASAKALSLAWFVIFASASLYSAFGSISAHSEARPEAIYLFLSMAALCGLAIILTIRDSRAAQ